MNHKTTKEEELDRKARAATSNLRGLERRLDRGPRGEAAQDSFERDASQAEADAAEDDDF